MRKLLSFIFIILLSVASFAQQAGQTAVTKPFRIVKQYGDRKAAIEALKQEVADCDSLLLVQPGNRELMLERAICCNLLAEYLLLDGQVSYSPYDNDMETDKARDLLQQQILWYYQQSLQHPDVLQQEPIEPYMEYVAFQWLADYVPTLYNLFACNYGQFLYYADYVESAEYHHFDRNQPVLYSAPGEFAKARFAVADTASLEYLYFRLAQEVTQRNLRDHYDMPVVRWTLERLQKWLTLTQNPTPHLPQLEMAETVLLDLATTYRNSRAYSDICYYLGQLYSEKLLNQPEKSHYYFSEASVSSINHPDDFTNFAAKECSRMENHTGFFKLEHPSHMTTAEQLGQIVSYRCDRFHFAITASHHYNKLLFSKKKCIFDTLITVERHGQFDYDTTLIVLPPLPEGEYAVWLDTVPFLAPGEKKHEWHIRETVKPWSDNVRASQTVRVYFSTPNTLTGIAMDHQTGAPVPRETFSLGKGYTFLRDLRSKSDGRVTVQYRHDTYRTLYNKKTYVDENIRTLPPLHNSKEVRFYTDRAVYRPGQTVELKAHVARYNSCRHKRVPKRHAKMVVAWSQQKDEQPFHYDTLRTNARGSIATRCTLPDDLQPGAVNITVMSCRERTALIRYRKWGTYRYKYHTFFGKTAVKVEEYKLPHFEVVLKKPTDELYLDDTVTIKGFVKAYAGYDIHDATLTYKIIGKRGNVKLLTGHGTVESDAGGNFTMKVPLFDLHNGEDVPYTVEVTATDGTGETQSAEITLKAQKSPSWLLFDLPPVLREGEVSRQPVIIRCTGSNQGLHYAAAHYRIERITPPDHFMHSASFANSKAKELFGSRFPQLAFEGENLEENWPVEQVVASGDLLICDATDFTLPELPAGTYRITWQPAEQSGGSWTVPPAHFSVYRPGMTSSPLYTGVMAWVDEQEARAGDTLHFHVCSAIEHGTLYVDMFSLKGRITSFNLTNCPYYEFPYVVKKEDSVKILLVVNAVFDGKPYSHSLTVDLPATLSHLNCEWIVCDSSRVPWEKKQVRLRLTFPDGRPAKAEVLCSMYDAALDSYMPNVYTYFPFATNVNYYLKSSNEERPWICPLAPTIKCFSLKLRDVPQWSWPRPLHREQTVFRINPFRRESVVLDADCTRLEPVRGNRANRQRDELDGVDGINGMVVSGTQGVTSRDGVITSYSRSWGDDGFGEVGSPIEGAVRTHFAETVFFYPWLETDKNGEITFDFTLPESLTRWKLQGVAHTSSLTGCVFSREIITRKPVMAMPHLPRFLYEGDSISLATKMVTGLALPVTGQMRANISGGRSSQKVAEWSQPIQWDSLAVQTLKFGLTVPQGIPSLSVFFSVQAKKGNATYTDAVNLAVPVLSRRQLITESVPFFITRQGSRAFALPHLPASAELAQCQLTFCPDPTWNVVLALPQLMETSYTCSDHLLVELFSNLVLAQLVHQQHNFKGTASDFAQLLSVIDGQKLQTRTTQLQTKLAAAQNSDGGWPWFKGGYSSHYITRSMLMFYGRMRKLEDMPIPELNMKKALQWESKRVEEWYEYQKKHFPKALLLPHASYDIVEYLYIRSLYNDMDVPYTEADKFYLDVLEGWAWTLEDPYLQALTALVCHAQGKDYTAAELLKEARKGAKRTEELGMWWPSANGMSADIRLQVAMIEAFGEILHDTLAVRDMELWLLQQKRAQEWGSAPATAQACMVLLSGHTDRREGQPVTLRVGYNQYQFADTLQVPFEQKMSAAVVAVADSVVVTRAADGFSYGTLSWQQWVDIDSIAPQTQELPLSIERRLTLTDSNDMFYRRSISENDTLHVGDQVMVELTIHADRDMDFLHLCDRRAAAFDPGTLSSGYTYDYSYLEYYYRVVRDTQVEFFMEKVTAGTHHLYYPLTVTQTGKFAGGYATVESFYAPEFNAHTSSTGTIVVKE